MNHLADFRKTSRDTADAQRATISISIRIHFRVILREINFVISHGAITRGVKCFDSVMFHGILNRVARLAETKERVFANVLPCIFVRMSR